MYGKIRPFKRFYTLIVWRIKTNQITWRFTVLRYLQHKSINLTQ